MKTIPTTHFCITNDELIVLLRDREMIDLVAVRVSDRVSSRTPTLAKIADLIDSRSPLAIAPSVNDLAFVADASWWQVVYRTVRNQPIKYAPSLDKSRNAAMLSAPSIDADARRVLPGFISSYPGESGLYRNFAGILESGLRRRDGMLVSNQVEALLDGGYTLWLG